MQKNNLMKILFGLSSFYPEHTAGTENYVLNLAKELEKYNIEVSVTFPSAGKQIKNYTYEGIKVYPFFVPLKLSTKELNGLDNVTGIKDFSEILDEIKPTIFHLHSLSRSFHAEHIKIAKQKGIKTVFTGHLGSTFCVNGDIQIFQQHTCNAFVQKQKCLACFIKKNKKYNILISKTLAIIINLLIRTPLKNKFPAFNIVKYKLFQHQLLKKYSDSNIAIAPWLQKAFELNNFSKINIVNQGINSKFLTTKHKTQNNVPLNLIFIGRTHPDKGIHILMEAINEYKKYFNLIIITLPFKDEMQYYEKIKSSYFLLGYNNWYENISQAEVSEKLNSADVLVLPSTKNEAAPLVILEAFAKKVPVIGSDYVAIPDMVKHNFNGLIFNNGDVNSLKEQLQRIIDEPDLISKLSENIEIPRTFEDVAIDMLKIYQKLL